jgi:hypothetical protein
MQGCDRADGKAERMDTVSHNGSKRLSAVQSTPLSLVDQTKDGEDSLGDYAESGSGVVDLDPLYLDDVVLKVSYDLPSVDQVNDPAGFLEELKMIER